MSKEKVIEVNRSTCEMLRGGLQDFPPSPKKKKDKEKASVKVSTSLLVKTRFTWEPQSVTVQSNSLAGLTNHGFDALSSNAVKIKSKIHHDGS